MGIVAHAGCWTFCVTNKRKTLLPDGIATNPLTRKRGRVTAESAGAWAVLPAAGPLAGSMVIGIFKSPTRDERSGHWEGPTHPGRRRMVVKQERPPRSPGAWGPHRGASVPGSGEGLRAWPCRYCACRKAPEISLESLLQEQNPITKALSLLSKHPLRPHL